MAVPNHPRTRIWEHSTDNGTSVCVTTADIFARRVHDTRSPENEPSYSAMQVFVLGLAMVVTMTHEKTVRSVAETLLDVEEST